MAALYARWTVKLSAVYFRQVTCRITCESQPYNVDIYREFAYVNLEAMPILACAWKIVSQKDGVTLADVGY